MNSDNEVILDIALRDAVLSTFGHYDLALLPKGRSPALKVASHDAVGVIGFTGARLRGTLVLATSTTLIAATCPQEADPTLAERDRVRDWVGELTNMVLGRVKVAMARHGELVGLSTPVAFTGEHIRLGAVQANRTRSWDFTSELGDLRVWLECKFEQDFVLTPLDDPEPDLEAGEPLLF